MVAPPQIQALPTGKRRDIERLAGGQEKPISMIFRFKDVIEIKRGPSAESCVSIPITTRQLSFRVPTLGEKASNYFMGILRIHDTRAVEIGKVRDSQTPSCWHTIQHGKPSTSSFHFGRAKCRLPEL